MSAQNSESARTASPTDSLLRTRLLSFGQAAKNQLPGEDRVESDRAHLEKAIEWLFRSQDVTNCAGSAASYNLFLGWQDPYPETSGYIVPTLYDYADLTGASEAAERATAMAEWLVDIQHDQGSFPGGTGTDGPPNVFNTGQVIFGLAAAHRWTGDQRYEQAIAKACEWLVDVQSESGPWHDYDYREETHSYTTRVGWALLVGGEVCGNDYSPPVRRLFDWALRQQHSNGWFDKAAFTRGERPFLHTIAYTVRGLLEGGKLLNESAPVAAARQAADALLERQRGSRPLKGAYGPAWEPSWYYCLTGNAQMAIVWARLYETTGQEAYRRAARDAVDFIKRHQQLAGSAPVRGGIPGSYPFFGRYMYFRYPNWAAKFFADALLSLGRIGASDLSSKGDQ